MATTHCLVRLANGINLKTKILSQGQKMGMRLGETSEPRTELLPLPCTLIPFLVLLVRHWNLHLISYR